MKQFWKKDYGRWAICEGISREVSKGIAIVSEGYCRIFFRWILEPINWEILNLRFSKKKSVNFWWNSMTFYRNLRQNFRKKLPMDFLKKTSEYQSLPWGNLQNLLRESLVDSFRNISNNWCKNISKKPRKFLNKSKKHFLNKSIPDETPRGAS